MQYLTNEKSLYKISYSLQKVGYIYNCTQLRLVFTNKEYILTLRFEKTWHKTFPFKHWKCSRNCTYAKIDSWVKTKSHAHSFVNKTWLQNHTYDMVTSIVAWNILDVFAIELCFNVCPTFMFFLLVQQVTDFWTFLVKCVETGVRANTMGSTAATVSHAFPPKYLQGSRSQEIRKSADYLYFHRKYRQSADLHIICDLHDYAYRSNGNYDGFIVVY